jgi:hypothetical protein
VTIVRNSDALIALRQIAQIQQSNEHTPNVLGDRIIPIIDITPRKNRIINIVRRGTANNATSGTIYATPAANTQDFYLTSVVLSYIKDATSTATRMFVQATLEDGTTVSVLEMRGITLTAAADGISISFPFPIKILGGTNITVQNDTGTAVVQTTGIITGYLVSNVNG